MGKVFRQTDTAAACGAVAGCSGLPLGSLVKSFSCERGGTLGSTAQDVTILPLTTVVSFAFQLEGVTDSVWPAGDWIIPFNLTDGSSTNLKLQQIFICAMSDSCVSQGTVASEVGIDLVLDSNGIVSTTVNQSSDFEADAGDDPYILIVLENLSSLSNITPEITPDQKITSAIPRNESIPVGSGG